MSKIKQAKDLDGHLSKSELMIRELVESLLHGDTKPKADDRTKSNEALNKAFKRISKLHPSLSESDSRSLNQLIYATYKQSEMKNQLDSMSFDDEQYDKVFNRIDKLEKLIDKLEDKLHIVLKYRLGQSHSITKMVMEAMKTIESSSETNEQENELDDILMGSMRYE